MTLAEAKRDDTPPAQVGGILSKYITSASSGQHLPLYSSVDRWQSSRLTVPDIILGTLPPPARQSPLLSTP